MGELTPELLIAKYQLTPFQPIASVLQGIDTINWPALEHAYGPATDVPALLHATLSDDEEDRDFAFRLLHETIWHQGTVYQASAYTVPFLLQMLQGSDIPDKDSVAFMLASLADGSSYLQEHAFSSHRNLQHYRDWFAREGWNLEEAYAKELHWVNATRAAVGRRLDLIYPYLAHTDATFRWCIAKALRQYPEWAQATLPLLETALAKETDKYTKQEIQIAITSLRRSVSDAPRETDPKIDLQHESFTISDQAHRTPSRDSNNNIASEILDDELPF